MQQLFNYVDSTMSLPDQVTLKTKSNVLHLQYGDEHFDLPAEYLRVLSPSAEVRGHGPEQAVLQFGKQFVKLRSITPQGNYAIRLTFDDGHDSGIYSWEYLYELGKNQTSLWNQYLMQLNQAGKSRDPDEQAVTFFQPK